MKLVVAIIPPDRLDRALDALTDSHVHGLTVSDVRGFGQEHDLSHPDHREFPGLILKRKTRIEIACHDAEVEGILQAIQSVAQTGQRGDGKVWVLELTDALRLKTGERGASALGPERK